MGRHSRYLLDSFAVGAEQARPEPEGFAVLYESTLGPRGGR